MSSSAAAAAASSSPTSEILATELRCNACWKVCHNAAVDGSSSASSYRTRCSHLFCERCARHYFSRPREGSGVVQCPVCDSACDGETGILRLSHSHGLEALCAAFSLAASFPEDALAVAAEGIKFNREQLALAGTREIYVRARMLTDAQAAAAQAAALQVSSRALHCT